MRFDFNVLTWDTGEAVQLDRLHQAFVDGRHDGIYLRVARGERLSSLAFLLDFEGLSYLEVKGSVNDDSDGFRLRSLTELTLLTRCKKPVPTVDESHLVALHLDDRPGIDRLTGVADLHRLFVWGFKPSDLACLSGFSSLARLKVEGRGQELDPRGLERCGALDDVELLDMRLTRLDAFRDLQRISRLWLTGKATSASERTLALEDLGALKRLQELRITYQGSVTSVQPLLSLPRLRDLRLRGTRIADGNMAALAQLAQRANVLGPNE